LIQDWLVPRVRERTFHLLANEVDVYAAAPSILLKKCISVVANDGSEAWYYFTYLRTKKGGRTNHSVEVDGVSWCWHGEHCSKPVFSTLRTSDKVGYRELFSFGIKDDGGHLERDGWIMTELGLKEDEANRLVLCKVYSTKRDVTGKRPRLDRRNDPCKKRRPPQQHYPSADVYQQALPQKASPCLNQYAP
jgi:hypothetical protein